MTALECSTGVLPEHSKNASLLVHITIRFYGEGLRDCFDVQEVYPMNFVDVPRVR